MPTMDFNEFSLRYALICALAVVAIYMLVLLLRLIRIRRRRGTVGAQVKIEEVGAAGQDVYISGFRAQMLGVPEQESMPQPQAQYSSDFGEQLYRSGVEAELQ